MRRERDGGRMDSKVKGNIRRGEGVMNVQRVGGGMERWRQREREVGPYPSHMGGRHERGREIDSYPSHCSHVRPHLIGQFVMSL